VLARAQRLQQPQLQHQREVGQISPLLRPPAPLGRLGLQRAETVHPFPATAPAAPATHAAARAGGAQRVELAAHALARAPHGLGDAVQQPTAVVGVEQREQRALRVAVAGLQQPDRRREHLHAQTRVAPTARAGT